MVPNRVLILYILKVVSVYSAIKSGWSVRKISNNTFEFTHPIDAYINEDTFDLEEFVSNITCEVKLGNPYIDSQSWRIERIGRTPVLSSGSTITLLSE